MKRFNRIINILICLIIIIQPVLELIYFNGTFEIFTLQLSTFIRLLLFGTLSIFVLLNFKNLKYRKIFCVYLILVSIYFIMHHMNALNFHFYDNFNFNYSLLSELSYLLRLLIPIFLIYYVVNSNLKSKNIKMAIIIITIVINLTLIISNIFKFSICSYGYGPIAGNIFDWFLNPGANNYLLLASRGLFNHVTIFYLIILISPLIINYFIKSKTKKECIFYALMIFLSLISAFIVGTKATTLGYIIIIIVYFILNLFFGLIKKEYKISIIKTIYLAILIMISFIVIPYSPMTNRNDVDTFLEEEKISEENENSNLINIINIDVIKPYIDDTLIEQLNIKNNLVDINELLNIVKDESLKKKILIKSIEDKYMDYGITEKFIVTSYPFKIDPYFWKAFIDNTEYYERSNNRMVIETIYKRVMEVNNNKYDKLLGITYSRSSNIFNLERDFLYQYYSMGLIGSILLLGPYIIIILSIGVIMIKYYKKQLNLLNCSLLLGIGLTICLAFYSGNTIDSLGITMPLGIMLGYLIKNKNIQSTSDVIN